MQSIFRRLFFDLWYLRRPPWDTGVTPPELYDFVEAHAPGRALDLGCGTGTNAIFLARAGWQAFGVDFAAGAIRQARRKAARSGLPVHFYVDDVTRLRGIHGSFDLILDIGCYHGLSVPVRTAYRTNLPALLAPGGSLLLYTHLLADGEISRSGIGIPEPELALPGAGLHLMQRQDSLDRWGRKAAWAEFRRA